MGWFFNFFRSSIGKKFIMAITGIFLILFLIIHLIGNITLYFGPDTFNGYVHTLELVKPLIRVIEVVLGLIFVLHIYNGIKLWFENRKSKGKKYEVNASSENSSIFSRTMVQTGSIIFIFLVIHLQTFWWKFNFSGTEQDLYTIVTGSFESALYSGFYFIAMILLGFHLNHGFQSAFQTFGWNHKKYTPLIKLLGTIYSIIMAIGFGSIPIYFFFFYGGQ